MLSISDLKPGEQAVVMELPTDFDVKRSLLVHGIHVGGRIQLQQTFNAQQLALISLNGRKVALRHHDCHLIKVVKVDD